MTIYPQAINRKNNGAVQIGTADMVSLLLESPLMNPILAQKLIAKGLLPRETEVEASYLAFGLDGQQTVPAKGIFVIESITGEGENTVLNLVSTRDGSSRKLPPQSIIAIDGMDPVRFASVYNIKEDGGDQKQGKRRGRRPKVRVSLDG